MPLTSFFSETVWNFELNALMQSFFNIKAHMREISSTSEMLICWDDSPAITHLKLTSFIYKASYIC